MPSSPSTEKSNAIILGAVEEIISLTGKEESMPLLLPIAKQIFGLDLPACIVNYTNGKNTIP
jgi:hypothetical protein